MNRRFKLFSVGEVHFVRRVIIGQLLGNQHRSGGQTSAFHRRADGVEEVLGRHRMPEITGHLRHSKQLVVACRYCRWWLRAAVEHRLHAVVLAQLDELWGPVGIGLRKCLVSGTPRFKT